MNMTLLAELERGSYLSLATRKRSGEWVATPVWFAPHEGSYYLFSAGDAGKVKRLRNFNAARIAPCTVSGRLTGAWIDVSAFLLEDEADAALALAALRRKYGWQMRLTDLLSRVTGKMTRRRYIRVDPMAA
ncbi:MAG TPA: PPOX class F420-dependent oxidoreductase [Kineobactrum sp.]